VLLGAALSLFAVVPARAQELRFRQLTPDAGLSSSYVQSIFQDRTGFLWFGTDKGLDRYDGYVIHSYRHRRSDPHSIADGTIHVLHADPGDTMWVGTNAGLSRYDASQDAFINYTIGSGERTVHGIADESRGGLWIAADDGLYRFDRATGAATLLDGAAGGSLRGVPILALHTDRRGQLWIGTQTRGLVSLRCFGRCDLFFQPCDFVRRIFTRRHDISLLRRDFLRRLRESFLFAPQKLQFRLMTMLRVITNPYGFRAQRCLRGLSPRVLAFCLLTHDLQHTRAQIGRLAHVQHLTAHVAENVDTRRTGQAVGEFELGDVCRAGQRR